MNRPALPFLFCLCFCFFLVPLVFSAGCGDKFPPCKAGQTALIRPSTVASTTNSATSTASPTPTARASGKPANKATAANVPVLSNPQATAKKAKPANVTAPRRAAQKQARSTLAPEPAKPGNKPAARISNGLRAKTRSALPPKKSAATTKTTTATEEPTKTAAL